jgi:hypothetical protein
MIFEPEAPFFSSPVVSRLEFGRKRPAHLKRHKKPSAGLDFQHLIVNYFVEKENVLIFASHFYGKVGF